MINWYLDLASTNQELQKCVGKRKALKFEKESSKYPIASCNLKLSTQILLEKCHFSMECAFLNHILTRYCKKCPGCCP